METLRMSYRFLEDSESPLRSGAMKKGIGVSGKKGMVRRGVGGATRPAKPKTDGKNERRGSWRRESSLSMRRKEGRRILEGVKGKSSASSQRPVWG